MEIYKYCIKEPHSFMHINYANHDINRGRFCKKFEAILHLSDNDKDVSESESQQSDEEQSNEINSKADVMDDKTSLGGGKNNKSGSMGKRTSMAHGKGRASTRSQRSQSDRTTDSEFTQKPIHSRSHRGRETLRKIREFGLR